MTPTPDPPYELEVARADLMHAVGIVARAIGNLPGDASFRFEDGTLSIEAANTVADAPARGTWPRPIFVCTSGVRRLAKRMPAGDPIRLRIDEGTLYANRYSEPCAWTPRQPLSLPPPRINEAILVMEAARILEPLRIKPSDLEELVSAARARGAAPCSEEEKKMIGIIAKAWVLLAPLGVETSDLRLLVDNVVRNAWK
jgi:hypothetical protein